MRKPNKAEFILAGVAAVSFGVIGRLATNNGDFFSSPGLEPGSAGSGALPAASAPLKPSGCPDKGDPMPDPKAMELCFPPSPTAKPTPSTTLNKFDCERISISNMTLDSTAIDGTVPATTGEACINVFDRNTSEQIGIVAPHAAVSIICYDQAKQTIVFRTTGNPSLVGESAYEELGKMTQEGGYAFPQCGDTNLSVYMDGQQASQAPGATHVPSPMPS